MPESPFRQAAAPRFIHRGNARRLLAGRRHPAGHPRRAGRRCLAGCPLRTVRQPRAGRRDGAMPSACRETQSSCLHQASGVVERANGQGVESWWSIKGQAGAPDANGDTDYERLADDLGANQPEEEVASTRFNSQSILGRRVLVYGGPQKGTLPSARNTRARSSTQNAGASACSRRDPRHDLRQREN